MSIYLRTPSYTKAFIDANFYTQAQIHNLGLNDFAQTSLADPGADRIVFWDESDNQFEFLTPNTGLTIVGNNLNVNLNMFETIACPAGTNPVADSTADTLNLAAGSNKISIIGTAATDTVTFDVVPANINLNDLAQTALADPDADKIVFWDDSDTQFEFLTPNTGLSITNNNLDVSLSGFSLNDIGGTSLADPGADKIVFWDESDNLFEFLDLGTGLSITGNTLNMSGLRYIVSDLTLGSHTGDTNETTIGSCTIPANSVSTGVVIFASLSGTGVKDSPGASFRLKVGPAASETTRQTVTYPSQDINSRIVGLTLLYYVTGETWTNDVSVLVTVQNGVDGAVGACDSIIVIGY